VMSPCWSPVTCTRQVIVRRRLSQGMKNVLRESDRGQIKGYVDTDIRESQSWTNEISTFGPIRGFRWFNFFGKNLLSPLHPSAFPPPLHPSGCYCVGTTTDFKGMGPRIEALQHEYEKLREDYDIEITIQCSAFTYLVGSKRSCKRVILLPGRLEALAGLFRPSRRKPKCDRTATRRDRA
jgi:hypothetical protein